MASMAAGGPGPEGDALAESAVQVRRRRNDATAGGACSTHARHVSQDFIYILETHATNCEAQGKYVEAEIARNRLDELKLHEMNRKKEAMRARHIAERLGVEEAHMLEFQQFNLVWDKKMAAYEENAAELVMEMKERHAAELKDFQQRLLAKASIPRHSKELLNLRKVQDTLARNKRCVLWCCSLA